MNISEKKQSQFPSPEQIQKIVTKKKTFYSRIRTKVGILTILAEIFCPMLYFDEFRRSSLKANIPWTESIEIGPILILCFLIALPYLFVLIDTMIKLDNYQKGRFKLIHGVCTDKREYRNRNGYHFYVTIEFETYEKYPYINGEYSIVAEDYDRTHLGSTLWLSVPLSDDHFNDSLLDQYAMRLS